MPNAASSPLNPYVRMIINSDDYYELQLMLNVPEACLPPANEIQSGPAEEVMAEMDIPTGTSWVVRIILNHAKYLEAENACQYAVTSLDLVTESACPGGEILVSVVWDKDTTGETPKGIHGPGSGPETPGKTVIQFEDALDQR